jgi:hypothetical protein
MNASMTRAQSILFELAFESFSADYGMTCGNDLMIEVASKHFASSTYRSHLVAPPSRPYASR